MTVYKFPLIDGALPTQSKSEIVAEMAAILVGADAFQTEAGALRVLMDTRAYPAFELMLHIDDARQLAAQEVVAREMAAS